MSRRVSDKTKIKEGRGQAFGPNYVPADYIPWIKVSEVSSVGRKHRVMSHTVGRVHHLLSDLEYYYFLLLDYNDEVVDILEQYPLSLKTTLEIARNANYRHIRDSNGKPCVMTTDFLIIYRNGDLKARAVKPSNKLTKRTLEKLDIERRFFNINKIDWKIVTENQIDIAKARYIEFCNDNYEKKSLCPFLKNDDLYMPVIRDLCNTLINISDVPLIMVVRDFEIRWNLPRGAGLNIYKHIVARKFLKIDISEPYNPNKPVRIMQDTFMLENYDECK